MKHIVKKNKPKNNTPIKRRKARITAQKWKTFARVFSIIMLLILIGVLYISTPKIISYFYDQLARVGFVVREVNLHGKNYANKEKISKTLKIKYNSPIFAISLSDLKSKLESIDWIKYAAVERKLPDKINIIIKERVPVALGQKNKKLYIIDEEGAIINNFDLKSHSHLPIIIGEGAEMHANSLIKMLKVEPRLFKHIYSVIRVSERRWNVRFDNQLEVKLPEEDAEKAWNLVIKLYHKNELFSSDIVSLDLRIPNKIFVEKK